MDAPGGENGGSHQASVSNNSWASLLFRADLFSKVLALVFRGLLGRQNSSLPSWYLQKGWREAGSFPFSLICKSAFSFRSRGSLFLPRRNRQEQKGHLLPPFLLVFAVDQRRVCSLFHNLRLCKKVSAISQKVFSGVKGGFEKGTIDQIKR